MRALITGSSRGLGKEIAIYLDSLGYDIILVSRNKEELIKVSKLLNNFTEIIVKDLSNIEDVYSLYEETKNYNIDLLVNNAGIGLYGNFNEIPLEKDINMLNINVVSVHVLTKLYLNDMIKNGKGAILNISSLASFSYGPLMSQYYATKAYITNLTCAIHKELKIKNSKVKISCACPGPINTNFNKNIGINFSQKPLDVKYVAKYCIDKCLKNKLIIIPGIINKICRIVTKFIPINILLKINYNINLRKNIKNG